MILKNHTVTIHENLIYIHCSNKFYLFGTGFGNKRGELYGTFDSEHKELKSIAIIGDTLYALEKDDPYTLLRYDRTTFEVISDCLLFSTSY